MSAAPQHDSANKLNIVILYDSGSMHVSTLWEYLDAFRQHSRHNIYFLPATNCDWLNQEPRPEIPDFSLFDVAIVHHSVRISVPDHLNKDIANKLAAYDGLKLLIIQDEYDMTETARRWMDRLQFDIVYNGIPEQDCEKIYPRQRFPKTQFRQVLCGYLPDTKQVEKYALPPEQRKIWIGYRGRVLPFHYGALTREKYTIGVEFKKLAAQRGIPADIEVANDQRIYGSNWYRFLGSARATLGTESGSNVFDIDGSIESAVEQALAQQPGVTYEEIQRTVLAPYEGMVIMNQISPKIFEAIQLRTALILFEGNYSGVVKPDIHYIPLKKDFSNIDDVLKKLQDTAYLKQLTDRAYSDVVESGDYSYRRFIESIDADIDARIKSPARHQSIWSLIKAHRKNGTLRTVVPQSGDRPPAPPVVKRNIFQSYLRKAYNLTLRPFVRLAYRQTRRHHGIVYFALRPVFLRLPETVRDKLVRQSKR